MFGLHAAGDDPDWRGGGRRAAVSRPGVRAHPQAAPGARDGGRHDVPLPRRDAPRGARPRVRGRGRTDVRTAAARPWRASSSRPDSSTAARRHRPDPARPRRPALGRPPRLRGRLQGDLGGRLERDDAPDLLALRRPGLPPSRQAVRPCAGPRTDGTIGRPSGRPAAIHDARSEQADGRPGTRAGPRPPPDAARVTIREAVEGDWRECGRICYEAFATLAVRHGFRPTSRPSRPRPSPSATSSSTPGSTACRRARRPHPGQQLPRRAVPISAIGPVSVDPTAQDEGVGRRYGGHARTRRRAPAPACAWSRSPTTTVPCASTRSSASTCVPASPRSTGTARADAARSSRPPAYPDDRPPVTRRASASTGTTGRASSRRPSGAGTARVVEHLGRITGYTAGVSYWNHSVAETTATSRRSSARRRRSARRAFSCRSTTGNSSAGASRTGCASTS